jgi:hypothetical protein
VSHAVHIPGAIRVDEQHRPLAQGTASRVDEALLA